MGKDKKSSNFTRILAYSGSYFGAIVGAGFASGQEIMQFYTNYGPMSLIAIVLAAILFIWVGIRFVELGNKLHTNTHGPVMEFLCGKYVGKVFDYILLFFMFGTFSIMVSGGATNMEQYFGVNPYLGRIIMTVATVVAISFSLDVTLKIGGYISPLIVVVSLIIGLICIFKPSGSLSEAQQIISSSDLTTSAPNIWVSVLIYVTYCIMPNCPILISIGNNDELAKRRKAGAIGGAVALGICLLCINAAMLMNYGEIAGSELPMVELAIGIYEPMGKIFAIILLGAIFTTAISGLYGVVSRFAVCGTKKGIILASVVGLAGMLLGFVPFSSLVGTLYPLMGYIGLIVIVAIAVRRIQEIKAK